MKTILLLEDDAGLARELRGACEAIGYEVLTARSGLHALGVLFSTAVNAIVLDVRMPRMRGLSLAGTLRGSASLQHIPMVAVAGPIALRRLAAMGGGGFDVLLPGASAPRLLPRLLTGVLRLPPEEARAGCPRT